jgi:eukaryotic-like serine/threonine-protein kinase
MLALEGRLPAVLDGSATPVNGAECYQFAELCRIKNRYASAVRFSADAFTALPALVADPRTGARYNAACMAALAGAGGGEDAANLNDESRAKLREQARQWLQADLAAWASHLDAADPAGGLPLRRTLAHWQHDPDLAGLRDAAEIEELPLLEQERCKTLWRDVAELASRSQEEMSGENK